jgi:hypothetical protein
VKYYFSYFFRQISKIKNIHLSMNFPLMYISYFKMPYFTTAKVCVTTNWLLINSDSDVGRMAMHLRGIFDEKMATIDKPPTTPITGNVPKKVATPPPPTANIPPTANKGVEKNSGSNELAVTPSTTPKVTKKKTTPGGLSVTIPATPTTPTGPPTVDTKKRKADSQKSYKIENSQFLIFSGLLQQRRRRK